jgi:hypothetical protein
VNTDLVFYDGEGYAKVRDFLKSRGVRHVLLTGYNVDMCVISTTCGYLNLKQDFNVFLVGDATLATCPASITPRFATQVALCNAALTTLVTQVGWVRVEGSGEPGPVGQAACLPNRVHTRASLTNPLPASGLAVSLLHQPQLRARR